MEVKNLQHLPCAKIHIYFALAHGPKRGPAHVCAGVKSPQLLLHFYSNSAIPIHHLLLSLHFGLHDFESSCSCLVYGCTLLKASLVYPRFILLLTICIVYTHIPFPRRIASHRIAMAGFDRGRRRIFILITAVGSIVLLFNLTLITGTDVKSKLQKIPIHIPSTDQRPTPTSDATPAPPKDVSSCRIVILK